VAENEGAATRKSTGMRDANARTTVLEWNMGSFDVGEKVPVQSDRRPAIHSLKRGRREKRIRESGY
jgi:hypothetical protein